MCFQKYFYSYFSISLFVLTFFTLYKKGYFYFYIITLSIRTWDLMSEQINTHSSNCSPVHFTSTCEGIQSLAVLLCY